MKVAKITFGTEYDRFNGRVANIDEKLRQASREVAQVFGGYTLSPVQYGGWVTPDGRLIEESARTFTIAFEPAQVARLRRLANGIGIRFNQDTVMVEIDGTVDFHKVSYD